MPSPAAFSATYSDWKLIRSRKVVQIVLEIPLEAAGQAYDVLGGMPNPGAETWCAVARLNGKDGEASSEGKGNGEDAPAPTEASPVRARKPVAVEKRFAQQAGMCCADPVFWEFLREHSMMKEPQTGFEGEEAAALAVRMICGVTTRADIIPGTPAGTAWDQLLSKFIAWRIAA